jgi:integrase
MTTAQLAKSPELQAALRELLGAMGLAPPDGGFPTIEAAAEEWRQSLLSRAERTQMTYRTAYNRFLDFLAVCDVHAALSTTETLTEQLVERYVVWLYQVYGAENRATVGTYQHGVLSLVRFLVRRRYLPFSFDYPRLKLTLAELTPRRQYRTPRVDVAGIARAVITATAAELPPRDRDTPTAKRYWPRELLTIARDRALLALLWHTGMRRDEVVRLNRDQLRDGAASEALIVGKG